MKLPLWRSLLETVLIGTLVGLIFSLMFDMPLLILLLVIYPVPFIYLARRHHNMCAIAAYLLSAFVISLCSGILLAAGIAIVMLIPSIAITHLVKTKGFKFETVMMACGSFLAGLALLGICIMLYTGKDIYTAILDAINNAFLSATPGTTPYTLMIFYGYFDSFTDILSGLANEGFMLALSGETSVNIAEYAARALSQLKPVLGPSIALGVLSATLFGGFFSLLTSRGIVKKSGVPVGAMRKFTTWRVPRPFVYTCAALLLGCLLGQMIAPNLFATAALLSMNLVSSIFSLMGMCFIMYLVKRAKKPTGIGVVIIVGILILLPDLLYFIGLFEQFLRLREKMDQQLSK